MKNRKLKKGFTLVELIVVIAIVAILAAVSVVSYLAFVNKGNESADIQLVKQLNTSLQGDEALNGKRSTMHEMLGAMEENGFVVENLTKTKSGYDIVWDQTNNRFALLDGEKLVYGEESYNKAEKYSVWKFADTLAEAQNKKYSVYLTDDFKTKETTLEISAGLDVGNFVGLSQINYTNTESAKNVVIRTNGGKLTVNAPADADTVKHYGDAQVVTLTAVGTNSYYEHGSVNLVDIKKGRLVITNDAEAEVGTIYLSATGDAYDDIILATMSGSELPDVVAREYVLNPETGKKLVVTIQTNVNAEGKNPTKTEEIYLYPSSDVKEGTNGYNVSDLGLLVVEAISSDAQAEAAEQISNGEVLEAVKETKTANLAEITAAATEFAGGKGTIKNPWLIVDYDTMQAISNHYNDDEQHYFKVKDGITEIDCSNWIAVDLYGHFDGNGVTFKNVDNILFRSIYQSAKNDEPAVIKNFSIEAYIVRSSYSSALAYSVGEKVEFSNINVTGYIEGSYVASFVSFGPFQFEGLSTATWTFNNCNSSAMLCGTAGAAGFVNHSFCASGSTAKLTNSKFMGEMRIVKATNTTSKNDYYGGTDGQITEEINAYNSAYYFQCMGNIVFDETFTDGTDVNSLHYYKWTSKTTQDTKQASVLCSRDRVTLAPSTSMQQLNTNGVNAVTVDATNASVTYAKAILFIGPNDAENEAGGYEGAYLTEELALNNGKFTTETIKTFKIAINGQFYDWTDNSWKYPSEITNKNETGIYGEYFNLALSSFYGRTYAQKHIDIIQYNSLNQVVSKTSVNFAVKTNLNVTDYTGNKFNNNGTVAGVIATKKAVFGTDYTLTLQDSELTANGLIVKLGNEVLIAEDDYTVEDGKLMLKASAIKQSTYTERDITVYKKLTIKLNGQVLDQSYQNQTNYNINVSGLTTNNINNLVVKVNGNVIEYGNGRYTVTNGVVKLDAKIMIGDVEITFTTN